MEWGKVYYEEPTRKTLKVTIKNKAFEATEEEIKAIYSLMHEVKEMLDIQYEPAGYNIGINVGYYTGQTIIHLHVHLILIYKEDVENPRGGIRHLK